MSNQERLSAVGIGGKALPMIEAHWMKSWGTNAYYPDGKPAEDHKAYDGWVTVDLPLELKQEMNCLVGKAMSLEFETEDHEKHQYPNAKMASCRVKDNVIQVSIEFLK